MKADLTRTTFDPLHHFSRVVMQQGRVQLDADWNEQTAILLHYLRSLAADLIGRCGGPANNVGFSISPAKVTGPAPNDFQIGTGRYYVDGFLCEVDPPSAAITTFVSNTKVQVDTWTLEGLSFAKQQFVEVFDAAATPVRAPLLVRITDVDYQSLTLTLGTNVSAFNKKPNAPRIRNAITYLTQPDFSATAFPAQGSYQVYLDVWERLITAAEADVIREVALNGPDTAARAKVIWQVKLQPTPAATTTCATPRDLEDSFQPANRGRLQARAKQAQISTDACTIAPDAVYRGAENQLYRVEIHTGSTDAAGASATPTFKWSRENGAIVLPISSMSSGGSTSTLFLETLGRDDRLGLAEGDWVEVQDDDYVLLNRAAPLLQVQSIDRLNLSVTLAGHPDPTISGNPSKHPLLRRWDQQAGDPADGGLTLGADNAALIVGDWRNLEDGVQIQFVDVATARFRTGDYWLIPARVATGDVEWPAETIIDNRGVAQTTPLALPPRGIEHHYAPLAIVAIDASGVVSVSKDCRSQINPLATLIQP